MRERRSPLHVRGAMGCCLSSNEERTDREPLAQSQPKYSWEREDRPDRSQLIISKQVGAVVGRLPGQLNGRQFHIQECEKCQILVLDYTSAVTVHGCSECDIVLGPCKGSVFIRQCTGCTVVVASQQFRARDCKRCAIYLHCKSQPVIEASHKLKFGCYQAYYPELRDQFQLAELHPFQNQWSHVHNFSNQTGRSDWSFADEATPPINPPTEGEFSGCGLTFLRSQSTVPCTTGPTARDTENESCIVVLVGMEKEKRAFEFLTKLSDQVAVVQTCHAHFKEQEAQAYFSSHESLLAIIRKGPCIVLELSGDNCLQVGQASLTGMDSELYHMSASEEEGERERSALATYLSSSLTM